MSIKRASFLHDMVSAEIFGFRNVRRDTDASALYNRLKEDTGRDDGLFMYYYSQRLTYTEKLSFNWHPEAPEEFTNLETWWNKAMSGEAPAELYLWYIDNISNVVGNQWQEELEKSHRVWKKPAEQTAQETADPNSVSSS